ncbi:MAG: ImmA/IrrE family metallo-endopeptidase [Rectinemataceae bacterium]
MRVEIRPEILRWASERSGIEEELIEHRFPKFLDWMSGESQPTLKQLEDFARYTRTPIGYLFLPAPPEEALPIPDFRTVGAARVRRPSPDLLETIYICQQRQEWYRDFARASGELPIAFVGSASLRSDARSIASEIRVAVGLDIEERRRYPTWIDALRGFIGRADELGVLVMCSGVVLNNNNRRLDPDEFRGFALSDSLAPLVFINGADTKAAQMFTLAHELAHLWLGASALSDVPASVYPDHEVELWCNRIAAEILAPLAVLKDEYDPNAEFDRETRRLARHFKVSTLVIIRRILDLGAISQERYWHEYQAEELRLRALPRRNGGDFYLTQAARVSKRFARALVASTLEGLTLHREAFSLLGLSKLATFQELGRSLGVI